MMRQPSCGAPSGGEGGVIAAGEGLDYCAVRGQRAVEKRNAHDFLPVPPEPLAGAQQDVGALPTWQRRSDLELHQGFRLAGRGDLSLIHI